MSPTESPLFHVFLDNMGLAECIQEMADAAGAQVAELHDFVG